VARITGISTRLHVFILAFHVLSWSAYLSLGQFFSYLTDLEKFFKYCGCYSAVMLQMSHPVLAV
jgi:hypothetical protein